MIMSADSGNVGSFSSVLKLFTIKYSREIADVAVRMNFNINIDQPGFDLLV